MRTYPCQRRKIPHASEEGDTSSTRLLGLAGTQGSVAFTSEMLEGTGAKACHAHGYEMCVAPLILTHSPSNRLPQQQILLNAF